LSVGNRAVLREVQEADRLLALWTPGGKPSRR
jgi:hypothetical protein